MAIYSNVGQFQEEIECFTDYADRFDAFLLANKIEDSRKSSLLLATIGPEPYKLLKNLCQPDKPSSKTYGELKQLLKDHYQPEPIVIAERHKFWTAQQGENEPVAEFIVKLKRLASTCSFGSFLDDALRDRLVSGLHSKMTRTQRQLLTVRDLTFGAARERCITDELAIKASQDHMGAHASSEETNRLVMYKKKAGRGSNGSKPTRVAPDLGLVDVGPCRCCGGKHLSFVCKFIPLVMDVTNQDIFAQCANL